MVRTTPCHGVGAESIPTPSYLIVGGRYIVMTTSTRYSHTDHLGSIAVITNEVGTVSRATRISLQIKLVAGP